MIFEYLKRPCTTREGCLLNAPFKELLVGGDNREVHFLALMMDTPRHKKPGVQGLRVCVVDQEYKRISVFM